MEEVIKYRVRSYDGTIEKEYSRYGNARKFASKLIDKDVMCCIEELSIEVDENGIGNLDTLNWHQVIGC